MICYDILAAISTAFFCRGGGEGYAGPLLEQKGDVDGRDCHQCYDSMVHSWVNPTRPHTRDHTTALTRTVRNESRFN